MITAFVEEAPRELTQLEHWGCPWSLEPQVVAWSQAFASWRTRPPRHAQIDGHTKWTVRIPPERGEGARMEVRLGDATARVHAARIVEVLGLLRDDPELEFEMLTDVTAVDYLGEQPRFEMVSMNFGFLASSPKAALTSIRASGQPRNGTPQRHRRWSNRPAARS